MVSDHDIGKHSIRGMQTLGENWDDERWLGIEGVPNIGSPRCSVVKENRKPRNLVLNSVASKAL